MKNFTCNLLLMLLAFTTTVKAQEVFEVEPGIGTLNSAIDEFQETKIYQLKAGKFYILSAPIENENFHLQIIGEEPVDGGMPATVQTGVLNNSVLPRMFDSKGDVTLKNIYFVNASLAGMGANEFFLESLEGATVVVDNCIIDPLGRSRGFRILGGKNKFLFTNNIVMRMGVTESNNDGPVFRFGEKGVINGVDTAIIENNTFVATGMSFIDEDWVFLPHNFIKVNHNTFVQHKSQIDWVVLNKEYYFTNNLLFDVQTGPYAYNWEPMPGADDGYPKVALLYADTIPGDVLPSNTVDFVQFNNLYRNPDFYKLLDTINYSCDTASIPRMNLQPFIWTENTPDHFRGSDNAVELSRESMLHNHEGNVNNDFPNWKVGNITYDIDPQFEDSRIYDASDSFVDWTYYATLVKALNFDANLFPGATDWPKYQWDPDGDIGLNNTWPIFNGKYSNPVLLNASMEKLPLGDLNWFPEAMKLWEDNKEAIDPHYYSLSEEQIDINIITPNLTKQVSSEVRVYPNPFSDVLSIEFNLKNKSDVSISIFNYVGQKVNEINMKGLSAGIHTSQLDGVNLNSGIYFYSIKFDNTTQVGKILKVN